MKIVLANTVGVDSNGWSIIAYPSRWTTASLGHDDAQVYYPRDLAYLSSLLKNETDHDVTLLDGCLDRYNKEQYALVIAELSPDWLVMENSTRTFNEDRWIAEKIKKTTGSKIMMTGQHVTSFPEEGLQFADVVMTGEYLKTVLRFFQDGAQFRGVIDSDPTSLIEVADLPFPEDEDVSRYDYALHADNICEYRQIQVFATRGCPFGCTYCVARHVYFGKAMWRMRPIKNVVAELVCLAEKYPLLEGFFFDDEIHNARISYVKELAQAIKKAGMNQYKYEAMCAYSPFDMESLELMKDAGYYKVRVGIETGSDKSAEGMGLKGKYRPKKLIEVLENARSVGIKVYGTFTLGGKGSSENDDSKTVDLMAALIESGLLDDCQISVCTPQPGTPFFDWANCVGAIDTSDWNRFDGGEDAVISIPGYSGEQIKQKRLSALKAYDRARRNRNKKVFKQNWKREIPLLGFSPKKILIFGSSRSWHLDDCFQSIFRYLHCEVAFLCQESNMADYLSRYPGIKPIVTSAPGFLCWERLTDEIQGRIKKFGADLAIIPCNNIHARGYNNVLKIAKMSNAKVIRFINSIGNLCEAEEPD